MPPERPVVPADAPAQAHPASVEGHSGHEEHHVIHLRWQARAARGQTGLRPRPSGRHGDELEAFPARHGKVDVLPGREGGLDEQRRVELVVGRGIGREVARAAIETLAALDRVEELA